MNNVNQINIRHVLRNIFCIELNSIVDRGINKINEIFISLNVLHS